MIRIWRQVLAAFLVAFSLLLVPTQSGAQNTSSTKAELDNAEEIRAAHLRRRATIDQQVNSTIIYMLNKFPETEDLLARSAGVLVIPIISKVGIFLGGAFGEGALRVQNETLDYYSAVQASFGLQLGVKQYSQVLFFMNDSSLEDFRRSDGWSVGHSMESVMIEESERYGFDTISSYTDVVGFVFGQAGAQISATINSTKYSRLDDLD